MDVFVATQRPLNARIHPPQPWKPVLVVKQKTTIVLKRINVQTFTLFDERKKLASLIHSSNFNCVNNANIAMHAHYPFRESANLHHVMDCSNASSVNSALNVNVLLNIMKIQSNVRYQQRHHHHHPQNSENRGVERQNTNTMLTIPQKKRWSI